MASPVSLENLDHDTKVNHSLLNGAQIALAVLHQTAHEAHYPEEKLTLWLNTPNVSINGFTPAEMIQRQPLVALELADEELGLAV